ncbi:MAG TPA: T9SS type A sorting domain-containing protein, partial [Bacteroidia bacterium]|nr:T9SS type A sorting domain-containing protein [Bacteroidia bacterium]
MKKTLLTFLLIPGITGIALAQSSIKIYDHITKLEVTNTTIQVYQDTSTYYSRSFNVMNVSSSNISTKARKEELIMAPGSSTASMSTPATSSICYAGTCFGSATYVSPCKPTNVGDTTLIFVSDFNYGNSYGPSLIRYTIYNCANSADSATFLVHFNASPTGIQNHVLNFSISDAYPNPASNTLSFNYKISNSSSTPHITIHNLLGNLVKSADMTESNGTAHLDVSDLEEGLYFYTLEVNNRPLAVKKFI